MEVICNHIVECHYGKNCLHGRPHKTDRSKLRPGCDGKPCSIFKEALCVPTSDEEDIT